MSSAIAISLLSIAIHVVMVKDLHVIIYVYNIIADNG